MTRAIYIRAVGMACPVGLTAATACAAMRAGIDRRSVTKYLGNDGEPLAASHLAQLGWQLTRRQRWLWLLSRSLRDLCRDENLASLERASLLLVAPETHEGQPAAAQVAAALSQDLGIRLDPGRMEVFSGGSYGGLHALAIARQRLLDPSSPHRQVIVAGADSYIEARALATLDRERRLLRRDNSDGLIPGEAAACLLLDAERRDSQATLLGVGLANEPGRRNNDIPLRGHGIVDAARQALAEAGLQLHDLNFRLSDTSGDAYGFKEQVLMISRLLRRNKAQFPLWLSATTLGDVGCAAGLCNIITAVTAWHRGYAPGPRAIAFAGTPEGGRAAVILATSSGR